MAPDGSWGHWGTPADSSIVPTSAQGLSILELWEPISEPWPDAGKGRQNGHLLLPRKQPDAPASGPAQLPSSCSVWVEFLFSALYFNYSKSRLFLCLPALPQHSVRPLSSGPLLPSLGLLSKGRPVTHSRPLRIEGRTPTFPRHVTDTHARTRPACTRSLHPWT